MSPGFYTSDANTHSNYPQEIIEVFEEKPDHHYRTEIPNIVFTLGLSPFAFMLYAFLKRVCGDSGRCWHSVASMAKECNMSETKLKECLKELASPLIKSLPLIKIQQRKKSDGSSDTSLITIIPIWRENGDYFRRGGVGRQTTQGGSPQNPGGSPNDYKEDLSQEKPSVVGEDPPSPLIIEKQITKDDLYHYSLAARKDWKPEEIESSWLAYSGAKAPISDPYLYIEGIINKKRILADAKQKEKKCKTMNKTNKSEYYGKNESSTSKKPFSVHDMPEPILGKFDYR